MAILNKGNRIGLLIGAFVVTGVLLLVSLGINNISENIEDRQTEWLEQSVKRSAIQCFVIEGSFPTTEQGVGYLEANYGLTIDPRRYVVYYESMGANLLPQVKVIVVKTSPYSKQASDFLGYTPNDLGGETPK